MNKTSKLFAGFAALALFAACSSDEPMGNNPEGPVTPVEGQKAYLSVKINSANETFGRATDFDTPAYTDGDENEHKVENAKFFFFDENGIYINLHVSVNDPQGAGNDSENIEWTLNNVLVLEDLTGTNYPKYMLTVLNMPGFEASETLEATSQALSKYADNSMPKLAEGETLKHVVDDATKFNFVMTTSSYFGSTNNHVDNDSFYCVNQLVDENFQTTPTAALNTKPVNVYVERLAAKVQLGVKINGTDDVKTLEDGTKIYKLETTLAGGDNGNNENIPGGVTANTPLYVKIEGWSLNAVATNSFMSKQLLPAWKTTDVFTNWNNEGYYRSYWAWSVPYRAGGAGATDELTFVAPKFLDGKLTNDEAGYAQYCYENTNTWENMTKTTTGGTNGDHVDVYNNRVTHVVVKATVCDENGDELDLVNFRGTPFLTSSFKAYVLSALKNSTAGLPYYYLTNSSVTAENATEKDYTQVDVTDIDLQGIKGTNLEKAEIVVSNKAQLYEKTVVEGETKFVAVETSVLTDRITEWVNGQDINWYRDGASIYYIPIEHNAKDATYGKEGYYGVVRNHWYNLEITKFSRLGHALYDPDNAEEVLKPEDPENPLYYVGARINILSWRVINQGVEL